MHIYMAWDIYIFRDIPRRERQQTHMSRCMTFHDNRDLHNERGSVRS